MLVPLTNAMATPANDACANASPTNDSPFQTTNAPTTAHNTPTISVAASARCMNGNINGSISNWGISGIANPSRLTVAAHVDGVEAVTEAHQRHARAIGRPQVRLVEYVAGRADGHDAP